MSKLIKKDNKYLAEKLYEYADWLEAQGNNPYKIRAYRRAAHVIFNHPKNLFTLIKNGFDVTELANVGKGIAYVIQIIITTGHFPETYNLTKKIQQKPKRLLKFL